MGVRKIKKICVRDKVINGCKKNTKDICKREMCIMDVRKIQRCISEKGI